MITCIHGLKDVFKFKSWERVKEDKEKVVCREPGVKGGHSERTEGPVAL